MSFCKCKMLLTSLLMLLQLTSRSWSYEAPEDEEDVFASTACPAFLTFTNAAYLAGVTVELPCNCKPQEVHSVVWFYRKQQGSFDETRVLSDHHGNKLLDTSQIPHSGDLQSRFSIRLFSLLIFRAEPSDSGLYICGSTNTDFFYGYDLDVQEAHRIIFSPRVKVKRLRSKVLTHPLYRVFTSFQPWSVCDRCGVPGEQVRVGLCYVHSRFLLVRYRRANQTVASCGSGAVPRAWVPLKDSLMGATLEVRNCLETCPAEAPPSSKLTALMAFLGYRSDSVPVRVAVLFLNHPADQDLTLGCPGSRPNMAVAWDQGSKQIYRSEHSLGSNVSSSPLRLWIDTAHNLVFHPANIQDSGVYYCWLQGRLAAEIHLLVYPPLGRGRSALSHPDFPAAVQMVLTSYAAMTALFCLLLFCRAGIKDVRDRAQTHVD